MAKQKDASGETGPNLVATFMVTDSLGNLFEVTTDADGKACVDSLGIGMASIVETIVPAGYSAPDIPDTDVTSGKCDQTTFTGATVMVENTPLTDVNIAIFSQVPGATETTIRCWGPDKDPADDAPDYEATVSTGDLDIPNLEPQILTCIIDIDP